MTTHITLRLAWHNDGWNGRICQRPANNTYCVGCSSYPGELVREQRDLEWEKQHAGQRFSQLDKPAACMYSGAAFSDESCDIIAEPPKFFADDTETKHWTIPAATACTWPYEAMYNREGVKEGNSYNYDKRLAFAEEHFAPLENDRSLVFYYANYSNPLSNDEVKRYLLIGVARIKDIAPTLYYDNCSQKTKDRYKGFIWQRSITSHYPEQGLRLPYHRYLHQPEVLAQFAAFPENQSLCKYATKQVSDDEALGLLEQLLESTRIVRDDVQDDSENWNQRIQWLESLIAELWQSRGAYPGIPAVLEFLGLEEAISGFRQRVEAGKETEAVIEVEDFLSGRTNHVTGYHPHKSDVDDLRRTISLECGDYLELLTKVLSRCSLNMDQLRLILSQEREEVGIVADLKAIEANPYLLAEQYTGVDANDRIRWSLIDRGMLPLPDLSAQPLFKKNSKERIRSLLLETLRGFTQQTFVAAPTLLNQVNERIKAQPEWKQNLLTEKYLAVDKNFYDEAIYQRKEGETNFLYDLDNWQHERAIAKELGALLTSPDIRLSRPVGDDFWKKVLHQPDCRLANSAKAEYEAAIESQKEACSKIINKRFATITGGAGTGKSTVIKALIKAIYKIQGDGASLAVIAPTGKATDRIRRLLDESALKSVQTSTIHSILAKYGWLNDNMTFRRQGGKRLADFATIIVDESSMIDLSLMAALFRAIDWGAVGRIILVGDAAQLPPIGVGKLYADIVSHLRKEYPEHLVELTENLRQMENRVSGKGNGILSLANCFINTAVRGDRDESEAEATEREKLVVRLHEGGEIDRDLTVHYWDDPETLQTTLIDQITRDFTNDGNRDKSPAKIWGDVLQSNINIMQILSPVRGELHGTESINQNVQKFKSAYWLNKGAVDGFTLFDKVIQVINRPKSRPLQCYNFDAKKQEDIEIFNGEIGSVVPPNYFDKRLKKMIMGWREIKKYNFRLQKIAVKFSGKDSINVNYFDRASDKPDANLELAYAISVHKSQGSEFDRVYFILPKASVSAQMMELVYTALTRASQHCTVFVEGNISTLINAMRPEQSALTSISSSLFEFSAVNEAMATKSAWYEAGKIHEAITGDMVRSMSEVVIANMLHERDITFWYEKPLQAGDGTMFLPDFTVQIRGELYYWEHLGMMEKPGYISHWETKKAWYDKHFPGKLVTTQGCSDAFKDAEGYRTDLSKQAAQVIKKLVSS